MALVYLEGFPSLGFIGARKLTTTPIPETPPPAPSPFNLGTKASESIANAVKEMSITPPPPPPPAPTAVSSLGTRATAAVASAAKSILAPAPAPSFTDTGTSFTAPTSTAKPASVYTDTGQSFAPASSSSGSSVAYGSGSSSVSPNTGVWTSSGPSPGSHVAQADAGSSISNPLVEAARELAQESGGGGGEFAPRIPGAGGVPIHPEKRFLGLTTKQLAIGAALVVAGYFFLKGGAPS